MTNPTYLHASTAPNITAATYYAHHVATVHGIAFYNVASTTASLPGLAGNITKSEFSPFTAYSAATEPTHPRHRTHPR
jgi:hypothetical protein